MESIGTQLLASSEYSQRRSGLAVSDAVHSTWAVVPLRFTSLTATTGGVLSTMIGLLISVASRAEAGGLDSRSLETTRKKYLPSAKMSASKVMEFSWRLERSSFHCVSSSPRKYRLCTRRSPSGSSTIHVIVICCAAARFKVWVGVPAAESPSVTVTLYGAAAAALAWTVGAACVTTLMLLSTGGVFWGR